MKIISPNIIATYLFARELRKGVYIDNPLNRKLGRVGMLYDEMENPELPKERGGLGDKKEPKTWDEKMSFLKKTYWVNISGMNGFWFKTRYPNMFVRYSNSSWVLIKNNKIIRRIKNIDEAIKELEKLNKKKDSQDIHTTNYHKKRYENDTLNHVDKNSYINKNEVANGGSKERVMNKDGNWEYEDK